MRGHLACIALAAVVPFALIAGCASVPASVPIMTARSLIDAEGALDAAVIGATTAVGAGLTSKAQNAEIAALTAPCPDGVTITTAVATASCPVVGFLSLARQAQAASDTASFPVLISKMLALATQLGTTHAVPAH